LEGIEKETELMREAHREELKREKERVEVRVRE
jgi:hypothetical protein